MALEQVVINNTPYEHLLNASIMKASAGVYTALIGDWFWAVLLFFLLVIVLIRTEDISYVFVYGFLGMLALGVRGIFPLVFKPFMYVILGIALMLTLYAFFVRQE